MAQRWIEALSPVGFCEEPAVAAADPMRALCEADPPTSGKAVWRFLRAAGAIFGVHLSRVRDNQGPGKSVDHSLLRTASSIATFELPGLLHVALLLAESEPVRATLHTELKPIGDDAFELAKVLLNTPDASLWHPKRPGVQVAQGPWIEINTRLQDKIVRAWAWAAPMVCESSPINTTKASGLPSISPAGSPLQSTPPMSIRQAAKFKGIDARTMRKAMEKGRARYQRCANNKWVFCFQGFPTAKHEVIRALERKPRSRTKK